MATQSHDSHHSDPEPDHSASDEEHQDNEIEQEDLPSFTFSTAPQLGLLSLPSPNFGSSFVDLLSPSSSAPPLPTNGTATGASRPPSRLRASSTLSQSRVSVYNPNGNGLNQSTHAREPTLNFSRPRQEADRRIRANLKKGRDEEEVFFARFPEVELELDFEGGGMESLGVFLRERGYELEPDSSLEGTFEKLDLVGDQLPSAPLPCRRTSDSFPLHLHLVPTDSDTLDILEHLSSPSIRSSARGKGLVPSVPVVGIVPLNAEWTAVVSERWDSVTGEDMRKVGDVGALLKDLTGALAFLHAQHIAYLSLSTAQPHSISRSPLTKKSTLSKFSNSIQLDPLAKMSLVTGLPDLAGGDLPPEMEGEGKDERPYDPFLVDVWCLGGVLELFLQKSSSEREKLQSLVSKMRSHRPEERPLSKEIAKVVAEVFPAP
ncbi:hypothetical protein T439DRAFT_374092 [Meredithblackwellia eburnea MCA 4105]